MLVKKNFLITILLGIALSNCSIPGSYFNISQATQPIKTKQQTYRPQIIPINSSLLLKTSKQINSLWYQNNYAYLIGDDDVLNIIVWDHPELNNPSMSPINILGSQDPNAHFISQTNLNPGVLVNNQGNIYFPYAGTLHVAGKTTDQIRQDIKQKLALMIKNPQVSIRVSNFRSKYINVIGAVRNPKPVTITDQPLTILNAIDQAGGIDKNSADTSNILVLRGNGAHPLIYLLNASSPSNLLISRKFKLYPKDIIYVPNTSMANWNKVISNLLPSLQSASITQAAIH
jgi:polysaccharide biosynthesis/export protein